MQIKAKLINGIVNSEVYEIRRALKRMYFNIPWLGPKFPQSLPGPIIGKLQQVIVTRVLEMGCRRVDEDLDESRSDTGSQAFLFDRF